jgi:hypothetical protein
VTVNRNSLAVRVGREVLGACLSLLLGIVGGALCGAAILVFNGLIGRSETTGAEYLGYWEVSEVWLGFFYGGFFGAIVAPFGYVVAVRRIGFQKSVWPAFVGTLAGGFLGAFAGPPVAVFAGICGLFVGVCLAKLGRNACEQTIQTVLRLARESQRV